MSNKYAKVAKPYNKPMKGTIKVFDQELYDKYDIPAREVIRRYLTNIVDNDDIFAEDMVITQPGCKYKYIELQVCATWTDNNYPHKLPYVYERKYYFDPATIYIIFNADYSRFLLFDQPSLNKEPVRECKFSRHFTHTVNWNRVINAPIDELSYDLINDY